MKTQKILISCILLLAMGLPTTFGKEAKTFVSSRAELLDAMNHILQKVPFVDYIGYEKTCEMTIVFVVDNNSELTGYKITSNNEPLNRVTTYMLEGSKLKADPELIGTTFQLKVNFVNQAYR